MHFETWQRVVPRFSVSTALWFLLMIALFPAPGPGVELSLDRLTIAVKPDKNPDRMLSEKAKLEEYLQRALEIPVEIIVPLSSAVITTGFGNGTIDLGYLSSTGAVTAIKEGVADVLLAGEIRGKPHYMSYWIALKGKPYSAIEDLRGKPVAFSSRTSTSGFLIPTWDLYRKNLVTLEDGPEGFFGGGNVHYGIGYVSAVEKVLNEEVEAAAVSYYVLDEDRHLDEAQRSRLRMFAQQGPVPSHIIAARRSLKPSDREEIKRALIELNRTSPKLRDKVFNSKLVEVDPREHLRITREALRLISRMKF